MPTRALLAASLGGAALIVAAVPAAADAASCAQAGSRTVRSSPFARVYYDRASRPFSCYRLTGRRVRLDVQVDPFYAPRDARLGVVRITKRILGYTWIDPGIPAIFVHSVDMRTGRFKRRTRIEPTVVIDPSAVSVPQIVVSDTGGIAWIQRLEGLYSVWRFDRRGRHKVGGPTKSRIASLRLHGSGIAWRQAGRLRSSTLR